MTIQIKLKDDVGTEFRELSLIVNLTHSNTLKELMKIYKEYIRFTIKGFSKD